MKYIFTLILMFLAASNIVNGMNKVKEANSETASKLIIKQAKSTYEDNKTQVLTGAAILGLAVYLFKNESSQTGSIFTIENIKQKLDDAKNYITTKTKNCYESYMNSDRSVKFLIVSGIIVAVASYKNSTSDNNVVEKNIYEEKEKTWQDLHSGLKNSLSDEQYFLQSGSVNLLFEMAKACDEYNKPFIFDQKVKLVQIGLKEIMNLRPEDIQKIRPILRNLRQEFFAALNEDQKILVDQMVDKYNSEKGF